MKGIIHIVAFFFVIVIQPSKLLGQVMNVYMTSDTLLVMDVYTDYLTSDIVNTGTDTLAVDIIRVENSLSTNWYSGLCVDVCYVSTIDSIRVTIPPNSTKEFKMYFSIFGGPPADTVDTKIKFRNVSDPGNFFVKNYYATVNPTLMLESDNLTQNQVIVFPNPATDYFILTLDDIPEGIYSLQIFNSEGHRVKTIVGLTSGQSVIERDNLASGLYFYQIQKGNSMLGNGKLIFR